MRKLPILLALLCLLASCSMPMEESTPTEPWPDRYIGKVEIVATLKGQTAYHVVKFEGSDALYLVSNRYYAVTPFLDGDGTPVTYDEFMERTEDAE